jgi:bifunctional enzyme CysN/CysC/sulfate adenylyltransferase subunit 1
MPALARATDGIRPGEGDKEIVRFVTLGSVDDGKSTLIGRLLYESGALYDDQIAQARRATRNGEELDFALFTDGLKAEREQGITIDVAYRYFETARRKYILADAPGHAQYTRNMATGASTADVAIVLIDARLGLLPQSRRHATIAALLGIPHIAVAVNKMDLIGFDADIFARIAEEMRSFCARLGLGALTFFPVSARDGDNVAQPSARMPWFEGGTVFDYLENVEVARERALLPLRLPVQTVLRPNLDYRGFAGQIASGTVQVGDELIVLPSGARTRVRAIDTFEGEVQQAFAPMSVALRLTDEVDVGRGDLIAHPASAPSLRTEIRATAVWLSPEPLDLDRPYLLKQTTRLVPARVEEIYFRLDPETLAKQPAEQLALNDIGSIAVRCARPIACDPYERDRTTGSFILIDALTNQTVAAGTIVVDEPLSGASRARNETGVRASAVFVVQREGAEAALLLAHQTERLLASSRRLCAVVRGPEAAIACAAAGLDAVVAAAGEAEGAAARAALLLSGAGFVELTFAGDPREEVDRALAWLSSDEVPGDAANDAAPATAPPSAPGSEKPEP